MDASTLDHFFQISHWRTDHWHRVLDLCVRNPKAYVSFYGMHVSDQRGVPTTEGDPGWLSLQDFKDAGVILEKRGLGRRRPSEEAIRLARLLEFDSIRRFDPKKYAEYIASWSEAELAEMSQGMPERDAFLANVAEVRRSVQRSGKPPRFRRDRSR